MIVIIEYNAFAALPYYSMINNSLRKVKMGAKLRLMMGMPSGNTFHLKHTSGHILNEFGAPPNYSLTLTSL